jgi:hypothetical protein
MPSIRSGYPGGPGATPWARLLGLGAEVEFVDVFEDDVDL